jgi:hypothetical protein
MRPRKEKGWAKVIIGEEHDANAESIGTVILEVDS